MAIWRRVNPKLLPPELQYTGRLSDALELGKLMKMAGAPEKDIAKAILRKLEKSKAKT